MISGASKCALNHSFRMSAFSFQNPLYGLSQRPSNQGDGFFIRKRLTRVIRTIFPQPQAFTQTDFNMRSSKPNPWGQAPYTPNRYFASMQWYLHQCKHPAHEAIFHRPTAYAAGVPERGFFRCRRKRMARLGETCVNAHYIFFPDGRLPFRCWEIVALCIFSVWLNTCGDDKIFMTSWQKRFRHAAAFVCKIGDKIFMG